MKVEYDKQADALYISLIRKPVYKSKEVSSDVIIDLDEQGRTLGVEILDISKKVPDKELAQIALKK